MATTYKTPAIPDVLIDDADLREILLALKTIAEVREGRHIDTSLRFITYYELVDYLSGNDELIVEASTAGHAHPTLYSVLSHTHASLYSVLSHDHSGLYAEITDIEGVYSLIVHDHEGLYSALKHQHDALYSSLNHDHDSTYSNLNHNHDGRYPERFHDHHQFEESEARAYWQSIS